MKLNTDKIIMEIERLGWSKYRLAKEMNMKNQTVYKILNNKKAVSYTFRTVEKFANALSITPKDLLI